MGRRGHWLPGAIALLAALLSSRVALAQEDMLQVRLEGWVAQHPAGWAPRGEVQVRAKEANVNFQVNEVRVLAGDGFGPDVLSGLVARRPGLYLFGPPPLLDRFTGAKPETYLALVGYLRKGTSNMNASDVTVLPAPKRP
jgi:hypothetical protein